LGSLKAYYRLVRFLYEVMMNKENMMLGVEALRLVDEDIKKAYTEIGLPAERSSPEGFETFLSTIISQQLSTSY